MLATHILQVLDETGDTKLLFDPDITEEVDNARATFDRLTKAGYAAFHVDDKGKQGTQMRVFDKTAGRIILVKALVGG